MERYRKWIVLLLCACLFAGLLQGCGKKTGRETDASQTEASAVGTYTNPVVTMSSPEEDDTPVTTAPSAPDYGAVYLDALAELEAQPALIIQTEITSEASCGGSTVKEDQTEIVKYQNRGTEDLTVLSTRVIRQEDFSFNLSQLYHKGRLYTTYRDSRYCAEETEENFLSLQTPAAMVDPAKYASVTAEGDRILFSEPTEAEAWAMPRGGKLEEASASATVKDGVLTGQTYEIRYTYAGTPIHMSYSSGIRTSLEADLSAGLPKDETGYTELGSSEALLILLRARFAMAHVRTISARTNETVFSQAANVIRTKKQNTHLCGSGKDLLFAQSLSIDLTDLQGTRKDAYTSEESLIDGVYTYAEGEAEPETEAIPSHELPGLSRQVSEGLAASLTDSIPDITLLTGATVFDLGDYFLVEYQCGEAYAKACDKSLNMTLFQDEKLLMNYAESYEAEPVEGYLAVEKYTWLPTAMGIVYRGTHVIEGTPALSGFDCSIGLSLYDPDTVKEITGEPAADAEPEEKPNPVFYEVSGRNGEKLYLFGTIHVGDDRTAFLPQAIYDAFDSADALAVEFDNTAFEDQIENDPELMQRVAAAYYYLDGTTIEDHLKEDGLFENAERFMKTIGQYDQYAARLKPFVWGNAIENFYLSQGRRLTASKGVDNRLMARARASEKEILDVESGISQLEMLSGYSEALQELLLKEAMGVNRCEYLDSLSELYDKWCAGSEAELIEMLAADEEDLEEMTEEERALYEEYHTALETSRNADMKEVAEGYLNSGKTVFFAVGLAHLLGDGGLVQSLRDAGYTVTLIQDS